jgi:hypothetical protein
MDGKHKAIDLTSEADGGVGLAADEAAEVAMAVAAVKAAEEVDEAAEVAVAVGAIKAAEEAEAVALAEEAIKAAEEAEMAEIAHQMRTTRLKYRDLRAELRARAVRNGVTGLSPRDLTTPASLRWTKRTKTRSTCHLGIPSISYCASPVLCSTGKSSTGKSSMGKSSTGKR